MQKRIDVGSEIDSQCGRCKLLLNHVVVAMVGTEPRKVKCLTCQSEHIHRVPKAKSTSSGTKRKAGATAKAKSASSALARWQTIISSWDDSAAKSYTIYDSFNVDDAITHVKFGRGGVIAVPGPDRIITLFESGEKMLMQAKKRP